jgi:hypothetical protein
VLDSKKEKRRATNKSFYPSNYHNLCIFGYAPYNKNGLHRKQFEENLVLFIAKEFVFLSFVAVFF